MRYRIVPVPWNGLRCGRQVAPPFLVARMVPAAPTALQRTAVKQATLYSGCVVPPLERARHRRQRLPAVQRLWLPATTSQQAGATTRLHPFAEVVHGFPKRVSPALLSGSSTVQRLGDDETARSTGASARHVLTGRHRVRNCRGTRCALTTPGAARAWSSLPGLWRCLHCCSRALPASGRS